MHLEPMKQRYVYFIKYNMYFIHFTFNKQKSLLPTKKRPSQVGWWIARHRKLTTLPPKTDAAAFERDVLLWWNDVQPAWRKGTGSLPVARYQPPSGSDEDVNGWDCLRKSGPNGFFLIILAFHWWGCSAGMSHQWKTGVADLRRCLERLSVSSRKRTPEPIGDVSRSEKRRRSV